MKQTAYKYLNMFSSNQNNKSSTMLWLVSRNARSDSFRNAAASFQYKTLSSEKVYGLLRRT